MQAPSLYYPVRARVLARYLSVTIAAFGGSSLATFGVACLLQESGPAISSGIVALVSLLLAGALRMTPPKRCRPSSSEVTVSICLTYLYGSIALGFSFWMAGMAFVPACFEAVSGLTTTGLSTIVEPETLPKATLFLRAWSQWIGGLGILIFATALLADRTVRETRLPSLQDEADDLLTGTRSVAKGILTIYLLLSLAGVGVLAWTGSSLLESCLLTFPAISTGGFSHYGDSLASLSSSTTRILSVLTLLGAVSLPFYYKIWWGRKTFGLQELQVPALLAVVALSAFLLGGSEQDWLLAISVQTTSGFSVSDLSTLSEAAKGGLSMLMLIGGGSSSTAGGLKLLRIFMLFFAVRGWVYQRGQVQHGVYTQFDKGKRLDEQSIHLSTLLTSLYGCVAAASWLCFLAYGAPPADALFEVCSALGTVGLSAGLTQPDLPYLLQGVLMIDMLLGRLEILPWLIFCTPWTWFGLRLEER